MSCESYRTAAYSSDIHWRIVFQVVGLGKSHENVAHHLNMDPSTVSRIVARFEQTGDISKNKYPPNTARTKLSDVGKSIILELVIDRPGI